MTNFILNAMVYDGWYEAMVDWQEAKSQKPVYQEYPTPGQTLFENRKAFGGLGFWSVSAIVDCPWSELSKQGKFLWETRAVAVEGIHELECYKKGKYFKYQKPLRKIRFVNRSGEIEV